jgi:hypothetical protein
MEEREIVRAEAIESPSGYVRVSIFLEPPERCATAYVRRDTAIGLAAQIVRVTNASDAELAERRSPAERAGAGMVASIRESFTAERLEREIKEKVRELLGAEAVERRLADERNEASVLIGRARMEGGEEERAAVCRFLERLNAECIAPEYSSDLSALAKRLECGEHLK